ncbi:LOW QUALITY PROTEIN: zinc finger protein 692 [Anguilla anguilla]|uniref:LOW QUALITY PROTEIN: zinc finger protein 692 n=1 Tax=Anguilla anguilla TaxID=7936 RepID=UPI0015A957DA|nr:LOW QUALITY PROTEIN: zinc finger protein 692 [Anguilla anguilla]
MSSPRDAQRRQRRRELDARRSKSRVRLGACLQSWGQLKERLGFALHSELAQHLLESYFSKACVKCSVGRGEAKGAKPVVTSEESLQCLVLQVHCHGQRCPLPPNLQPAGAVEGQAAGVGQAEGEGQSNRRKREEKKGRKDVRLEMRPAEGRGESGEGAQSELCLRYACQGGHVLAWCPSRTGQEGSGADGGEGGGARCPCWCEPIQRPREGRPMEEKRESSKEEACFSGKTRRCSKAGSTEGSQHADEEQEEEEEEGVQEEETVTGTETGESTTPGSVCVQEVEPEMERDQVTTEFPQSQEDCQLPGEEEREAGSPDVQTNNNYIPSPSRANPGCPSYSGDITSGKPTREVKKKPYSPHGDSTVIRQKTTRGKQRKAVQPAQARSSPRISKQENKRSTVPKRLGDDDISQISGKRKRKATPRDILPCEFDGCGKIFSSRQYLNHHMKYQHFHQKTFACSHPSCGKSFNFKKHLKEHEKLHSNQRDYICEFCARAFRTSSNLIIHRRIHTGEKPLQCEVCGFTCRQKASLNWHMRKHDAESGYQFPCEICGRRFEKRDNVTAHRSKSHPDHTPGPAPAVNSAAPVSETPSPLPERSALASDDPADPVHSADLAGRSSDPGDLSIVVM